MQNSFGQWKRSFAVRNVKSSVIIHSDAGSQYTSEDYKMTLGQYRAIQSMSDVGKCYDNARMESFFATLKKEKLYRIKTKNMTTEQVKTEVFRYVMSYYNRNRITTEILMDYHLQFTENNLKLSF